MSAARKTQLVGGLLDGRMVSLRSRPAFLWVDRRPGRKCYASPPPAPILEHCVLYRRACWREGLGRVRDGYLFAGLTHAVCSGCGAYVERVDGHVVDCSLCGGTLAR